jgi:hypothetical protein
VVNFDDLYRRKLFLKPEDEIKFPNLNWSPQFKFANMTVQWTEQNKLIDFEMVFAKNLKKNLKFDFNSTLKNSKVQIKYPSIGKLDTKYLQSNHGATLLNFDLSYFPSET